MGGFVPLGYDVKDRRLIVNKADLIRNEEDVNKIVGFVQENITRLLGFKPDIFPISAMLAQQAKSLGDRNPSERQKLWESSRFEALENYIFTTLDEEGRIQLKLLSPLGVGERISEVRAHQGGLGYGTVGCDEIGEHRKAAHRVIFGESH